ncbi:MAG: DUF3575 domain-containing protein [Prevotellaceae bacterium]|nr:DUF3575 domain-containing protein [Prevotellaceae bacterium]
MRTKAIRFIGYLFILTIGMMMAQPAKAQRYALSNNLVYSATLTPNLSFEVRPDSSWSYAISAGYRPWPTNDERARKYRHLSVDLQARHWDKAHPWKGAFYGFDAMWVHYNLSNIHLNYFGMFSAARHHRIQGNLYGVGALGGYAWDLGSGFTLEAEGALDLAWTHYRVYDLPHCGDPIAKVNRFYLIPKVALNIAWHF